MVVDYWKTKRISEYAGLNIGTAPRVRFLKLSGKFGHGSQQVFMRDNIIASHTCFGGNMDINC